MLGLLVVVLAACQSALDPDLAGQDDAEVNIPTKEAPAPSDPAVDPPSGSNDLSGTILRDTELGSHKPEIMTNDNRSRLMREITADWATDWEHHTVPYDELTPVIPRDAIRSLDDPTFETVEEATTWLNDSDPVIVVDFEGIVRAYPLRILVAHEIVNDRFKQRPVVVTYCPLCNSALVFDAMLNNQELEFGTSGWLRNSDLVMYDRTTESLWQQFTGEGIVGDYAGERLSFLSSSLISFSDFAAAFPSGQVLSKNTGFRFAYDFSAYSGYDSNREDPFLFSGEIDERLPATERVAAVSLGNIDIAYPLSILYDIGVVNDRLDGQDIVLFFAPGMTSAFYNPLIGGFTDVGATGVFDPNLDGQLLTFSKVGKTFVDDQTGSAWNILGQATDGPLAGKSLAAVIHGDYFWFAWAAFKPDTLIYGQ